ncbi:MAG: hypothetical protein JWP44_3356 [Mucilaginibacter sp.]|nr:hypothetical protein [Mucilaginibacter sp.]
MKLILSVIVCVIFAKASIAQSELLSFDEHNKYIYYQVVELPEMLADTLHNKTLNFLKRNYPKFKINTNDANDLNGHGEFLTYGGLSILKHEKGAVNYLLNIEFKDKKYRYWLTGFTFTPYKRDRYGDFVPQMGVEIPLEKALTKFDKKDVDGYLNETGAFCKQFGENLKQYLVKQPSPKKAEAIKKTVPDKW